MECLRTYDARRCDSVLNFSYLLEWMVVVNGPREGLMLDIGRSFYPFRLCFLLFYSYLDTSGASQAS